MALYVIVYWEYKRNPTSDPLSPPFLIIHGNAIYRLQFIVKFFGMILEHIGLKSLTPLAMPYVLVIIHLVVVCSLCRLGCTLTCGSFWARLSYSYCIPFLLMYTWWTSQAFYGIPIHKLTSSIYHRLLTTMHTKIALMTIRRRETCFIIIMVISII